MQLVIWHLRYHGILITVLTNAVSAAYTSEPTCTRRPKGERGIKSMLSLQPFEDKDNATDNFQLLIAPLTFISFLISLALIDSQNYNRRAHSHSPSRPAPTNAYGKTKNFIHSMFFRPASPYAYVKSPHIQAADAKDFKEESEPRDQPWYWHTKQRKMMKAEVADAFKIRKWVLVSLFAISAGSVFGTFILVRWCLEIWGSLNTRYGGSSTSSTPGHESWLSKDW